MPPEYTHYVKCRKKGDKRFAFIGDGGKLWWLRIRAYTFTRHGAENFIATTRRLNGDEWEYKMVPIKKGGKRG